MDQQGEQHEPASRSDRGRDHSCPCPEREAEHVREREVNARAGVGAESEVCRQVYRDPSQAGVAGGRVTDRAIVGESVNSRASENVYAVNRAAAAIERDSVLAGELEGVARVTLFDDLRAQEVRRWAAIEVKPARDLGKNSLRSPT